LKGKDVFSSGRCFGGSEPLVRTFEKSLDLFGRESLRDKAQAKNEDGFHNTVTLRTRSLPDQVNIEAGCTVGYDAANARSPNIPRFARDQ
jgi:hypothetical protein